MSCAAAGCSANIPQSWLRHPWPASSATQVVAKQTKRLANAPQPNWSANAFESRISR